MTTAEQPAVLILTDRADQRTERVIRAASAIGTPVVLDRSGTPPERFAGAEVLGVDWEDDGEIRRALADRRLPAVLALSDLEELLITDPVQACAELERDPLVLLDTPTGPQLRGVPGGEILDRVGGGAPTTVSGVLVRPWDDAPIRTSIIVPTFNRPSVAEAVRTALLQDAPATEVIVVNDGGLDPRPHLGGLLDADRLTVVDAERNRGHGAVRNLGIARASGEQVLFLDDDDRILPDHVSQLDRHLRDGDSQVVVGGAVMVHHDEAGVEIARYRRPGPDFDRDLLLVHNYVVLHTALTRLDAVRAVDGFDESMIVLEDWEFWLRVTARFRARSVPVWSAEYHLNDRLGANTISSSTPAQVDATRFVYGRHATAVESIVARRRQHLADHERELARVGATWPATVGILGHRDPFRTASIVRAIRAEHPNEEAQIIVHQPDHDDVETAFGPIRSFASWCIDRGGRPDLARERLTAQALGRELKIVDVDREVVAT